MPLLILAVILFIIADVAIRYISKRLKEQKAREQRAAVLDESLKLDYSREAKSLKRVEVENPKAKILCVDDEEVILDSFRKILVIDGYSIDTVQTGQEALGLIQTHHYDFLFTDLKMPEMDGHEVVKSVKHLRPDIDVIVITGYATVESAVECMKYGAMDYVQKPFTEEELLDFTGKILIKRQDRIQKQLKPKVHITHSAEEENIRKGEFAIPGGVFISEGHCWLSLADDGTARIGIDDFAKKLIGKIDDFEMPNLGMNIKKGQPLFVIKQGNRLIPFKAPISGVVTKINKLLEKDKEALELTPYDNNWFCIVEGENLEQELKELKLGKSAVAFYHDDLENLKKSIKMFVDNGANEYELKNNGEIYSGILEKLGEKDWEDVVNIFFDRQA